MSYPFTLYSLPDGRTSEHVMDQIRDEDAAWLGEMGITISLEDLRTGQIVVYGEYGHLTEEKEPIEVMYLVPDGERCIESMQKLCERLRSIL